VPRLRKAPPRTSPELVGAGPPPEEEEVRQAVHQGFFDNAVFLGVLAFDRQLALFRKQDFARGMTREAAREAVRECARRFAVETEEMRASVQAAGFRLHWDTIEKSNRIYARAMQAHEVERATTAGKRQSTQRTRLGANYAAAAAALRVREEAVARLESICGLEAPKEVEVTHRVFDEHLVHAAQETPDAEFVELAADHLPEARQLPRAPGGNDTRH
jgi:hypothetical protein